MIAKKCFCTAIWLLSLAWSIAAQSQEKVLHIYQGGQKDPFSLEYTDGQGSANKLIMINLVEGLIAMDAEQNIIPGQAREWEASSDGESVIFTLRENALWSNGERVVAQDFVVAWQNLVNPRFRRSTSGLLRWVKNYREIQSGELPSTALGVQAVGEDQLKVDLNASADVFLSSILHHPTAPVYSRDLTRTPTNRKSLVSDHKLFNGPYLPVKMDGGKLLELKKNPLYHSAEDVYFDRVIWEKKSGDNGAGIVALMGGAVDVLISDQTNQEHWLKKYAPHHETNLRTPLIYYIVFHENSGLENQEGIRKAIHMALSKEALNYADEKLSSNVLFRMNVDEMYESKQLPKQQWHNWSQERRLAEARSLLAASGYSAEKPFKLQLLSVLRKSFHKHGLLERMMKEIYVDIEIVSEEVGTFYRRLGNGNYQAAIVGWLKDFEDPLSHLGLLSTKHNYYRHKLGSEEIDRALIKASQIDDVKVREQAYLDIEALNQKGNYIIPLMSTRRLHYAGQDIVNSSPGYAGFSIRWMKRQEKAAPAP